MKKNIIIYFISSISFVFLSVLFGYSYGDLIISFLRDSQGTKKNLLLDENNSGKENLSVSLYFGSSDKNLLKKYSTKIVKGKNEIESIKNIVKALIKGPKRDGFFPTIPKETKLRSIFRGENGVLYLDFDRSISEKHIGGAWAEVVTLNSLGHSISSNFGEKIKRIVLLIEGQEALTLAGSVSISGSLTMKKKLISEVEINNLNPKNLPTRQVRGNLSPKKKVDPAGLPNKLLKKRMRIKEEINPVGIPTKKP